MKKKSKKAERPDELEEMGSTASTNAASTFGKGAWRQRLSSSVSEEGTALEDEVDEDPDNMSETSREVYDF